MKSVRIIQDYCDLHGLREQEQPVARLEAQAGDSVVYACLDCLRAAVALLEGQSKPPIQEHDTLTRQIDLYWQRHTKG